jgi:nitrogen PTS system EIIA component
MPEQENLRFSDFLKPENILCHLDAANWESAVEQLTTLLQKNEGGFDSDAVVKACLDRERASSTVIAPRLAIPHARVEGLDGVLVTVGTSYEGITFAHPARGPVHVIIAILTPKEDPGLYLQALAALTRELGANDAPDRLAECFTAEEIYKTLTQNGLTLPPYLRAGNLMQKQPVTLREGDTLNTVVETFCGKKLLDIPVIDEDRDVRGVLSIEDLMRLSLPDHLLWMHDLTPILRFEPFADLIRRDNETRVADFMRDEYVSVPPDVPAIQLGKLFLTEQVRQILVMEERRLLGSVDLTAFVSKVFWA